MTFTSFGCRLSLLLLLLCCFFGCILTIFVIMKDIQNKKEFHCFPFEAWQQEVFTWARVELHLDLRRGGVAPLLSQEERRRARSAMTPAGGQPGEKTWMEAETRQWVGASAELTGTMTQKISFLEERHFHVEKQHSILPDRRHGAPESVLFALQSLLWSTTPSMHDVKSEWIDYMHHDQINNQYNPPISIRRNF